MELPINTNLEEAVWPSWQTIKDNVNSWKKSAQEFEQSFKKTAEQTTDRAINTITNTLDQAEDSLGNSWQAVTEIKNNTSGAVENAINAYLQDLVSEHPAFAQFLQIFSWIINHPIISVVILLLIIALIFSIIKGIVRLIETASWSLLKVPFQLLRVLITTSFLSLNKAVKGNPKFTDVDTIISDDKQKRLLEISQRLELIHQEQKQLLQEAAKLIDLDK
ncbi:hypothetical protein [Anabaena sp. UHCC 0451]|uniref:hypothetical protein n=1 Tax=Anabaena sp. UHCC 0451 TaxID=2055235 RepID=UPI002B2008B4|nr:hypothetical protein [Anabaena sp. UHCC 0451]MEA5576486.1 hypothetical protein [Anabaena sp. UHCC 0451]